MPNTRFMLKGLGAILPAVFLAAAVLAASPAHAQYGRPQQQQQPLSPIDPYSFHSLEGAMTPTEAAAQFDLMSKAMNSLAPQRPGVVDTYILAAAFWDDPVFESEAKEGAAVLGRRYDATDRMIVLTAGKGGGVRSFPDSSPNNVQAALGKIATVIDPKEDLVLVFLTSHGAQDGTVAIQENLRVQGSLRPINLRNALTQAGIQNKLIIVSSCYSGHFVTPFFPDVNAAVFTAAATDKTSFGCEPSRDWTYFGDAMLNHALRGGAPLEDAFTEALGLIGKWEGDLHAAWQAQPASRRNPADEPQPSNPQSNIGGAVGPVIDKAEAYGRAINCAGNLAFAIDRAKTGRPLKGLADWAMLQKARDKHEAIAASEAAARKRSAQDTARTIGMVAAAALKLVGSQPADLAALAQQCVAATTAD